MLNASYSDAKFVIVDELEDVLEEGGALVNEQGIDLDMLAQFQWALFDLE